MGVEWYYGDACAIDLREMWMKLWRARSGWDLDIMVLLLFVMFPL
jgi:hypothetical protein